MTVKLTGYTSTPEKDESSSHLTDGSPVEMDGLFTDLHHNAACRIQNAYRRFRRRVSTRSKSHALIHWFREYSAIRTLSHCPVTYRQVVLGPLPHLLVCANAFRKRLEEQKNHAWQMVRTVNHAGLEDAMDRLHHIR